MLINGLQILEILFQTPENAQAQVKNFRTAVTNLKSAQKTK